ncbi:MAG: YceI family protein [Bacteroidota bacterium]
MKRSILLGIIILSSALAAFSQHTYLLDKNHARVVFSATHFGISHVEGNFKTIDATLNAKRKDLTDALITFTADVNSINTDVEYRDNDLKSAGYFDAAKFPVLNFTSTSFKKLGEKRYKLTGDLTIHGITKTVVFNVIANGTAITAMKKPTAGFTLTGRINRLNFGVGGPALTSGVSNSIELRSNLEFTLVN